MATSLAEQLRKLAVPQTNLLKGDKKKTSFLFDPKDAASLRRETVYEIGLEGLEELVAKNEAFNQYKSSLFHITSKNFERSVQSKEANKKVTESINQFLLLLAPYFLTNAAHKSLEWLFHRFMIHEYNKKELLMLALPYHNSNIFVKVLQTLKFRDENDPFNFLKPLQKPGLHLPKQSLLNNASSNITLLKYISKYIRQLIDYHENPNLLTAQLNFYCSIFLGAIEYSDVEEDVVSQMLPLILKGLNSSIPDFAAASYVVTARLLVKRQFSGKLLNNIVEKLSIVKCSSLKMEATLVMLVIYQSQTQFTDLPHVAIASLSEKEWLPSCLQYLNSNGNNIYPFLRVLVKRAADEGLNNDIPLSRKMIINILNEIKLDNWFVESFLSSIIDVLDPKAVYSEEANLWLYEVVNKLEVQYPSNFDEIVGKILGKNDVALETKTSLQKILGHVLTHKENFEIFNNLYHSREEIRKQALKSLCGKFTSLKTSEQELFKNYLFNSLYDKNPKVVRKMLNLIKTRSIRDDQLLQNVLTDLFMQEKLLSETWQDVFFLAVTLLCEDKQFTWEIFLFVFPLIILCGDRRSKRLKKLLTLKFFSNSQLFSAFSKEVSSKEGEINSKHFLTGFLTCFDSNVDLQAIKDFLKCLNNNQKIACISQYSAVYVLSRILPHSCSPEISAYILQYIKTFDFSRKNLVSKESSTLKGYVEISLKNKYPLEGIKECIKIIIIKTIRPTENLELINLSKDVSYSNFLENLFSLFFSVELFKDFFEHYLNIVSPNVGTKMGFCLNICVSEMLNEKCVVEVLAFIEKLVKAEKHTKDFTCIEKLTISYLLVLLDSPNTEVRKSVFNIIDILLKNSKIKDRNYIVFLEQILKHREEILVDNEQTSLIIHNLLAPVNTKSKKAGMEVDSILSSFLTVACDKSIPIYLKSGILGTLSYINNFKIFEDLCKNLLKLYGQDEVLDKHKSIILVKLINRVDSHVIPEVSLESSIWKFIKYALNNKQKLTVNDQKANLTELMLNQITRDVYAILSKDLLKELLDIICEISVTQEEPEVLALSNKIFKHLDLNAELITSILEKMKDVQVNKTDSLKKRRRINMTPTVDILETLEWKKGMSALEFMQGKKKIRNGECLLPLLFDILKKCLDFEEQAAVEYPKQLILSLILLICSKVEKETVPKNFFNIQLVIQCIRASQNPQTHHHALLLLANTAELIPTEVLHHIMAIFTFMGSSLIRHDDAYSFQIISKIIDTIIPILVSDGNAVVSVLRVFVDALLDVPEHRRIPLYNQLLKKIGTKENLHLFLLLVFEAQVLHASQERQKTEKGGLTPRLKIAQNICLDFSPKITLSSSIQLVKYLRQLPDEKEEMMETDKDKLMCNSHYTAKQFRHYKYLIVTFITGLLSSKQFVNEIAALTDEENLNMEELYKELIVSILTYIQRIQKVSEKSSTTQQSQYWKTVLYHSYDILDSVNALLTPQMFLLVIKGLLMHNIHTVKRRALELLNSKLQLNPQYFDDCDESEMYALIPPVITIVKLINQDEIAAEYEILVQTALLSLKLLVKAMGTDEPEKVLKILEFITSILISGKVQNNVLASVILCLVELCVHLRAHAISCLTDFMPAFLKILKNQKHQEVSSLLLLSAVTAVNKLLDSLSLFLSPYLQTIIYEISILICKWGYATNDQKLQALVGKLNSIKQKVGSRMPPRIIIPAIEESYDNLVRKKHFKAIGALMDILAESIQHLPMKDINSYMPELTSLFLKALQFRCDNNVTLEDGNLVEDHIVRALTVLVLKLSESTFRPLFLKLYDWAVRNEGKSDRIITFYNLSQNIAKSLKGLFVLFANHFFNNASQVLIKINKSSSEESYFEDESKNILLLEFVLKTLATIFTYDNQNFVNKNRFDLLMQPLADQLENTIGGIQALVTRNEKLLTPTIVHFLIAVADDALWKQINYQILLKMRNSMPDVRLAALHCLTEVVTKLGEDFLPLLPETIPFLAELLEDEEERVEKACQKAIHEMEKVLGEPLQKYF